MDARRPHQSHHQRSRSRSREPIYGQAPIHDNHQAHPRGGFPRSFLIDSPPDTHPPVPSSNPHQETPRILDIIGSNKELTVCGHIDLISMLPIRQREHVHLLREYVNRPGNYEGRYSDFFNSPARILDYGNNYVALRLYEDITRPELGEFLLDKGWKMIGFTSNKEDNKTFIMEKWCNIRDH